MKVGDLVTVGRHRIAGVQMGEDAPFVSIILEVREPEHHRNGMCLVKVFERGQFKWYPIGYIEVINENNNSC